MRENPFDVLEVDPRSDSKTLTKELKRRAERANDSERIIIQDAWQKVTLKEEDRLRWALLAHPRPAEASPQSIEFLISKLPISRKKLRPVEVSLTIVDALPSPTPHFAGLKFQPPTRFQT